METGRTDRAYTDYCRVLYRFLGQLLIGLRTQRNRKAEQQRYNNSYHRAYTDYCRVLDEDKQNKEALLMRAYIYILRRDYPAARIDYNRLLELDPQSYSGRLGLATLEQKEEKFRESLDILNKMIVETPEDATLYVARADVEREMKHEDLALVDLEEAIRLNASLVIITYTKILYPKAKVKFLRHYFHPFTFKRHLA